MRKIGFIDYYLSEWHANNYPAWIKRAAERMGEDFDVKYAWAELDVSPLDNVTSEEWCKKNGIELCGSIEELCEKSDYIIILAPSNPEVHLAYASVALKYGKNTYIDKTFAPDFDTAKKIFDIAKSYNTPFFSTSALRFADELTPYASKAKEVSITGGGREVSEYIIHQIEILVRLVGVGADKLTVTKTEDGYDATVNYPDGRFGRLSFAPNYDFNVKVRTDSDEASFCCASPFFDNLIADILRFFLDGKSSFNAKETLEVMKIRTEFLKQCVVL